MSKKRCGGICGAKTSSCPAMACRLRVCLLSLLWSAVWTGTRADTDAAVGEYCYNSSLIVFYPILSSEGTSNSSTLADYSGNGNPVDLTLDPNKYTWDDSLGSVSLSSSGVATNSSDASKLYSALTTSNAFSLEVWLATDHSSHAGSFPARIVSLSAGTTCPSDTDFTLGLETVM